jgi:glycosyltransferase involved in cell wall biosynthesis
MITTTPPLISIVMPVWNASPYLREAVDSILSQTFRDFELVAVDDGSEDDSVTILESYQDPRIRIIKQGRKGFVSAVNRGVEESRADWIARHDADDISYPLRLQRQWDAASADSSAVLSSCQPEHFGTNTHQGNNRFARSQAFITLRACSHCPVVVGAALIRRSAFLAAGGYKEEEFPAEDYAFASRLLKLGKFVGTPERLYRIRTHESQISQVKKEAQKNQSHRISIQNCAEYFRLDRDKFDEVYLILHPDNSSPSVKQSFRLLMFLLCFKKQSLEIWVWAFRRLLKSNFSKRELQ